MNTQEPRQFMKTIFEHKVLIEAVKLRGLDALIEDAKEQLERSMRMIVDIYEV